MSKGTVGSTSTDIRGDFHKLLCETVIPTSDSNREKAIKGRQIDDFLKENMPCPLFRYRTADKHYIEALKNGHISVTKPHKMKDKLDSLIKFDSSFIKMNINKYFPSFKALAEWAKNNKGVSEIPQFAIKSVPLLVRLVLGFGLKFVKKPDSIRSLQRSYKAVRKNLDKQIQALRGKVYDELQHTRYIACFCESVSEYRMWAEYTDNHKGFALEYDFSVSLPKKCRVFPVIYGAEYNATSFALLNIANELPLQVLKEHGLSKFWEWYFAKRRFTTLYDELFYLKGYAYKRKKYEKENEWRLLTPETNKTSPNYSEIPFTPTAIYFGENMEDSTFELLNEIATKQGLRKYRIEIDDVAKIATPYPIK